MSKRTKILKVGAAVAALALVGGVGAAVGATASNRAEATGQNAAEQGAAEQAKNVIFIQGDGMGMSLRQLIRIATVGKDGQLAMDSLEHAGWVSTDSAEPKDAVTDSAAGATAFATGVRTYNGAVGVDINGDPVRTLLEEAELGGKSTGLVTTSQVTDASPGAFGAHVPQRGDHSEIARQYLEESQPEVLLGGGEDWWFPKGEPGAWPDNPATDPTEESQGTGGNLVEQAKELGYNYVSDAKGLAEAKGPRLLGLFANEGMFVARNEGDGDVLDPEVSLADMASTALDVLSSDPDGFFLFLEQEATDEFAHWSNATRVIEAGQALDEAVEVALEYQKKHPDTLIVVAGDHATGGLAVEDVYAEDESGEGDTAEDGPFPIPGTDLEFTVDWTTYGHTGDATPITAQGPGSKRLAGAQLNTDVHDAVLRAMFPEK